jgi:hypothetical protein
VRTHQNWILEDLKERGLTVCQDADSAHTSEATKAWAEKHNLSLLTLFLPGVSPDFSILESIAHTPKGLFHSKWTASEKVALSRFTQNF